MKKKKFDTSQAGVRVTSSRLDSLIEGKIYQVGFDKRNRERYVVDENGDKVLFDMNIFQFEQSHLPYDPDWWDELTPEQQTDLDLAMEEIKNPANLVSNEEALKLFERWKV
jgi:hypothetical protein